MKQNTGKILVLEDSRTLAKLLGDRLRSSGYEVLVCADGQEGLNNLEGFRPDCVLTDYEMPVMNGIEFCKVFKSSSIGRDIPVIMLTSKDDARDILTGIAAGADDYLSKKIALEVVEVKIQAMLRLLQMRRDSVRLERLSTLKELIVTYNHQFNNPLAILMGYTGLIARDPKLMNFEMAEKFNKELRRIQAIVAKLTEVASASSADDVASEVYVEKTKMLKIS
jgi:DNA-binding response OmpR family regulator